MDIRNVWGIFLAAFFTTNEKSSPAIVGMEPNEKHDMTYPFPPIQPQKMGGQWLSRAFKHRNDTTGVFYTWDGIMSFGSWF